MAPIYPAIAINLDPHLLAAALPLFRRAEVDAVEWAFDSLYRQPTLPDWYADLLNTYGEAGRLMGHGVFFSLFSGWWLPQQQAWLDELARLTQQFQFAHITEHFGFMTGANFHQGAPMAVPLTPATLAIGQDRLRRIQQVCQCPVGLENLAFAWSAEAVAQHGYFLRRLVEPVNGFVILDLHNVYCQAVNFGIAPEALLDRYPLDRVREIHVSGGSWEPSAAQPGQQIRRDTHDGAVPEPVFELLATAIPRCTNLRFVVLEQLGTALATLRQQRQFRRDFRQMKTIVEAATYPGQVSDNQSLPPPQLQLPVTPVTDESLHDEQQTLARILETATDWQQAQRQLREAGFANSAWQTARWHPAMLEAAIAIAQKWKNGFV
jgi:uncharacterized protein